MQVWVTAPTDKEVQPLITWLESSSEPMGGQKYRFRGHDIVIKTTGVGAVATVFHLSRAFQQEMPDCVLQIGLAGSFASELSPGSVVRVACDRLADLGAEDHDCFLDIFALGLEPADAFPFQQGWLVNPYLERFPELALPAVRGITVQTVSGTASTITRRLALYHPQIETMEGAAFHYVCLQLHILFLQMRVISNYVVPRDKSKWQISTAIENLHYTLRQWLEAWLQ